jgi:probable selenium-dependent hydroxylase accessory protein YqeC
MEPDLKGVSSVIVDWLKDKGVEGAGKLIQAIGLRPREMISLVGAGGKTTLMFRLAKELLDSSKKVVTTTTTKILEPNPHETPFLFVEPDETRMKQRVRDHLDRYHHITLAGERLGSGKLKGISPELIGDLWSSTGVDYMVIEADGAAGRPIKAPRKHEPVIPLITTLVVALLGADGLEADLGESYVFQPERVSGLTGVPMGKPLTPESIAVLMTAPEGILKGTPSSSRVVVFLNKVDTPDGMEKARRAARKILEKRHRQIERVVLGQAKKDPPFVAVMFP